ncbi:MAG: nuclear transport factor 2 family protein [Sphingomonas sp.]|jgi:ketosteroid isomerase-like protein|uniref:nuclear transport factor 2 family protein n=1 Tax=Sphingomonas sp. TaxID=28214 RepID=UPI003567D0AF
MLSRESADRLAIRELIDRYHAAINRHDWELLDTLFAPDAVWEARAPIDLRFDGHDAVMTGLRNSVLRQELLVQTCSGVTVVLEDASRAMVTSTLIEFGRERENGHPWCAVAFYDDEVRKDHGRWKFTRRALQVRYLGDSSLTGQVFVPERICPAGNSAPTKGSFGRMLGWG